MTAENQRQSSLKGWDDQKIDKIACQNQNSVINIEIG